MYTVLKKLTIVLLATVGLYRQVPDYGFDLSNHNRIAHVAI